MLQKVLWIGGAGLAGTLARYFLSSFVNRRLDGGFPWGTLTVNVLGCFLFGIIWSYAQKPSWLREDVALLVLVGFMGAFTTFSTFGFETAQLFRSSHYMLAVLNVLLNNVLGLALLFAGLAIGRLI